MKMNGPKSTQTFMIVYSYFRRRCCRCWYDEELKHFVSKTGQRRTTKQALIFYHKLVLLFSRMCNQDICCGKMLIYAGLMKWAEFGRKNQQFESIITKSPPTPAPSTPLPPGEAHTRGWQLYQGCSWPLLDWDWMSVPDQCLQFLQCPVLLPRVGSYRGLFVQLGPPI